MKIFPLGKAKESHSLPDLIKGLQYAVSSAQDMLVAQHIQMFESYFDSDGVALTKKIKNGAGAHIDVPLLTLMPHNSLLLDEIEITFAARIQHVSNYQAANAPLAVSLANFEMNVASPAQSKSDKDVMNVSLRFKAAPPPEGFARIVDDYYKKL